MTLEDLAARIALRLPAAVAQAPWLCSVAIAFDFGAEGVVVVRPGLEPAVIAGPAGPVDCRLKLSLDDFLGLARREIHPQKAFLTGRIRIEGDIGLARSIAALLVR
jgi:putative sterol carrier protein